MRTLLVLVALLGVGSTGGDYRDGSTTEAAAILDRFAEAPTMEMTCADCIYCGAGWYRWDVTLPFQPYSASETNGCSATGCPTEECPTALSPVEMGRLWAALQVVEGEELEVLLAHYNDVLAYVPERAVIQVSACDALIGQVAVDAQARGLAE